MCVCVYTVYNTVHLWLQKVYVTFSKSYTIEARDFITRLMLPLAGGSDCVMHDVDIGVKNTPQVILLSSSDDISNLFRSISFNS